MNEPNRPPWATEQLPSKHCIALTVWIDNELSRMQRIRNWVAATYMHEPLILARPGYNPKFCVDDALNALLHQRRSSDKTLITLLKKIALDLENEYNDRMRAARKGATK